MLASYWNELSEYQLGNLASDLEFYYTKNKYYKDANLMIEQAVLFNKLYLSTIRVLLSSNNFFKTWYALKQIPPEFYQEKVLALISGNTRTKFPAAFRIGKTEFHPPQDKIFNLTMKEFSFADALYFKWRETGNHNLLIILAATLYRPERKKGNKEEDIRESFVKSSMVKRADLFESKLSKKQLLSIVYAYEGSRNHVAKLYPNVFPKQPEPEEGEEAKEIPKSGYVEFGKLIDHKVKFDHSKIREVNGLNIHEFFKTYENELIEIKKTLARS